MNTNDARTGCNGDRNARCGKIRSKHLGGIFATSEVANVGIFGCFSGAVFARKYARKYLRPIFARKFVKKVANMGYLPHLRPHLQQAKNDLLPANVSIACKSSSFFAEILESEFVKGA